MALAIVIIVGTGVPAAMAAEIVVYSARKEHLVKPLFDAYKNETGVKITYITGHAGPLMQRLKAEGKNTPADILITVDAGNLWFAAKEGILQPVNSDILKNNVPSHLKEPNNLWFGLSIRARTIAYNKNKVKPGELSTYEDLGSAKWKGRLCLRTSKKVYNQSLVAMFIAEHGEKETERIVSSWVKNLATEPFFSDTKVMEAIGSGQCDGGIVNSYYYGRLEKKFDGLKLNPGEEENFPLALFWPNQDSAGVHVNVSGAGLIKHARHKERAIKFLEWLSSEKAQNLFTDSNMEYPVNPRVKAHPTVVSWGEFKQNVINVSKAGELQAASIKLMDRVGYR